MESFTVELTVLNCCGALNRITGVYSKRKYNIDSLTLRETAHPGVSYMEIVSRGSEAEQEQLVRQLNKLFDVKTAVLRNGSQNCKEEEK